MKHLCKLAFLPALFLLLTVNSANAAFPTEKQKVAEVSLVYNATVTKTTEKSLTKSELKKEMPQCIHNYSLLLLFSMH